MTKFCKDCKYYKRILGEPSSCLNKVAYISVVEGWVSYAYCLQERGVLESCGPEGRNFEPKKPLTPHPTSETIRARCYDWFKTFWK